MYGIKLLQHLNITWFYTVTRQHLFIVVHILHFYRPQRSCSKVMFSQACVKNSVHRGVSDPACTTGHMTRGVGGLCLGRGSLSRGGGSLSGGSLLETPLDRDPPPSPYGNERAVRILLECILVKENFDKSCPWTKIYKRKDIDLHGALVP